MAIVGWMRLLAAVGGSAMLWLLLGMPALGLLLAVRAAPDLVLPSVPPGVAAQLAAGVPGRIELLGCYRERIEGITHVHLEGDPLTIGFCQGVLVGDHIARIETEMMGVFIERVPVFMLRHLLLGLINWNNRNLESYFTASERLEIAAITEGHRLYHDPYAAVSSAYSRALQYHALHDISQYLIDNPLVQPPQVGCTAVAVDGTRARDGHLLVGRLFDFEGGRCFDADKVVYSVRPAGGIPFVSVSWGGMAGAATGINDAGLWVSINAGATDGQAFVGRPMIMVVRQVLEHCHTISEALAVIRQAEVFVSDSVLLASASEGRTVVAEKGPHGMGVREMSGHAIAVTNHFLSAPWLTDASNAERIARHTTAKRLARAEQLLQETAVHDPASILALLRDRRGLDGADLGFGNRGTINAWIGAHLVVCDVSAKRLWVCAPYHGLGRAVAFGIDGPLNLPPLPASADLELYLAHGEEYNTLEAAATAALKAGSRAEAARLCARLLELNPRSYTANTLAAEASDDAVTRRTLLLKARDLQPAYADDAERITALLMAR